ncbi:UCHL1, partial [Symbiodinium sp. KB8]
DWALEMVRLIDSIPAPVIAVVFLYPIKDSTEAHRAAEKERIAKDGQEVSDKLYYTKQVRAAQVPVVAAGCVLAQALRALRSVAPEQTRCSALTPALCRPPQTIGNACGTIGLLHAIANVSDLTGGDVPLGERCIAAAAVLRSTPSPATAPGRPAATVSARRIAPPPPHLRTAPGKWWHSFVSKTKDMSADDKAAALEADEEEEHKKTATDESAAVLETEDVYTHFIAFVQKDGCLYELDGRKDSPINHGASSKDSVLKDSMKVMREFMARDEGEIRFTMLALAPAAE